MLLILMAHFNCLQFFHLVRKHVLRDSSISWVTNLDGQQVEDIVSPASDLRAVQNSLLGMSGLFVPKLDHTSRSGSSSGCRRAAIALKKTLACIEKFAVGCVQGVGNSGSNLLLHDLTNNGSKDRLDEPSDPGEFALAQAYKVLQQEIDVGRADLHTRNGKISISVRRSDSEPTLRDFSRSSSNFSRAVSKKSGLIHSGILMHILLQSINSLLNRAALSQLHNCLLQTVDHDLTLITRKFLLGTLLSPCLRVEVRNRLQCSSFVLAFDWAVDALCARSCTSTRTLDWSFSHCFVNLARRLPESLRFGSVGFRTSEESKDLRLMTSSSDEAHAEGLCHRGTGVAEAVDGRTRISRSEQESNREHESKRRKFVMISSSLRGSKHRSSYKSFDHDNAEWNSVNIRGRESENIPSAGKIGGVGAVPAVAHGFAKEQSKRKRLKPFINLNQTARRAMRAAFS
ncbi:hypothetical protein KCU85_g250, partial [Aureobasidium melanogenum]